MPRYHYKCKGCTKEWWEWRGMTEPEISVCPTCLQEEVIKIPAFFSHQQTTGNSPKQKVGDVTKEHIEENREMLKQMKQEARTNEWSSND